MIRMANSSEKKMAMTELDKQDLFGEIAGSVVARKFGNLKYIAYTHRVFI